MFSGNVLNGQYLFGTRNVLSKCVDCLVNLTPSLDKFYTGKYWPFNTLSESIYK